MFRMLNAITWPLPDFAQQVFHRHPGVVEDERPGGGALDAHLLLFRPDGDAREVPLDDEGGEFLAVDLGIDDEDIGETGSW